jgi:DNA-binding GntR family transcriptional regulator
MIAKSVKRTARPAAAEPIAVRAQGAIYERIWTSIVDHSLPPGTKLTEDRLGEIFGVGRTRIRQVLFQLAHEGVVRLEPNRGAFVAQPTVRDAREVFEARRAIEWAVVARALHMLAPAGIKRLREHLRREQAARDGNDRRALIKLSGEFHLMLADASGNQVLSGILRELVSRASLIIALYEYPGAHSCPPDEHNAILDAIEKRSAHAPDLMRQHLEHVERSLVLRDGNAPGVDLKSIFGEEAGAPAGTGEQHADQGDQPEHHSGNDPEDRRRSVKRRRVRN